MYIKLFFGVKNQTIQKLIIASNSEKKGQNCQFISFISDFFHTIASLFYYALNYSFYIQKLYI